MDPSTVRALLPTLATVLVVAAGAGATRALHAGVPAGVVVLALLLAAATGAGVLIARRATRRRDDLDREWLAVERAWRDRSQ